MIHDFMKLKFGSKRNSFYFKLWSRDTVSCLFVVFLFTRLGAGVISVSLEMLSSTLFWARATSLRAT